MLRISEGKILATSYGDKVTLSQLLEYAHVNKLDVTPGDNQNPVTYLTLARIPMCEMPRIETWMFTDSWHFGSPVYKRVKTDP